MNEAELAKSRKGRKKLEALEKQIERVSGEFDNRYLHTREMKYLKENIKWSIVLIIFCKMHLVLVQWFQISHKF